HWGPSRGRGSLVQAVLTQPPSVSANVGQTVQITCSGASSSYAYYGWFQQKVPGSAPVTVIYRDNQRPSAEDEAVYYCVIQKPPAITGAS
uniref:Ig-like domain-containing protein n=1 Tax=Buteo japonicus TaxID=224669 RepID=A0A8C0BP00_9AVES